MKVELYGYSQLRVTGTPEELAYAKEHKEELLAQARRAALTKDPRPDLAEDSQAWAALLTQAWDGGERRGLHGVLHGLRCLGCRLEPSPDGGFRLTSSGIDDYAELRAKWLMPHSARLTELLRNLKPETEVQDGIRD